jgi:predicted ferric reductase
MTSRVLKNHIGMSVVVALTFFPLIPWLVMKPLELRFSDAFFTLTSIGQISGLLGVTLFSLTLILSARLHFMEEYFGGLDRVYRVHSYLGTIAFLLLLIHPLVLAIRLIPLSVVDAAKSLLLGSDWAVNFGILSLLLMMSLLGITFYMKWRFQYLYWV